jgi:hypothetical protein
VVTRRAGDFTFGMALLLNDGVVSRQNSGASRACPAIYL